MGNVYKNQMDAMRIYTMGYNVSGMGKGVDVKSYFKSLRDAVISEYERQGYCELVDYIIGAKESIDGVVYSAFCDATNGLNGQGVSTDGEYIPFLLWGPKRVTWNDWITIRRQSGAAYNYMNVTSMIHELKKAGQKAHLQFLDAKQDEEKKNTDEQNQKAIDEARKAADGIIANARAEAGKILAEAKMKRAESRTGANISEAAISSKAVSEELVRKYIREDRLRYKKELESELNDKLSNQFEILGKVEIMHNEMCERTNSIQASWNLALSNALDEINKYKAELYKYLHDWQASLYPYELRSVAERYVELYRIINVERLLNEEILFQAFKDGTSAGNLNRPKNDGIVIKDTGVSKNLPAPSTIEGLKKLNKTLTTFLHKFELSLNGFDMYVFYPKQGDKFDEVWHVLDDDADFSNSKDYQVESCVVPGVAKKVNDAGEDDVIIPAIVTV